MAEATSPPSKWHPSDRLSLLYPGGSEILFLLCGIVLGGMLFSRLNRRTRSITISDLEHQAHHSHRRCPPDKHTSNPSLPAHSQASPTLLSQAISPLEPALNDRLQPLLANPDLQSSSESPSQPSPVLTDLPPPLRTTVHQPFNRTRPWTSADFAYHPYPSPCSHLSSEQQQQHRKAPYPQRPWKRHHTHANPALHITDHVAYLPDAHNGHDDTTIADTEPLNSRRYRRRRTLTFETLPHQDGVPGTGKSVSASAHAVGGSDRSGWYDLAVEVEKAVAGSGARSRTSAAAVSAAKAVEAPTGSVGGCGGQAVV